MQLLQLGFLFGLYFFMQAFGYALGANLSRPRSVYDSVVYGTTHLRYILQPWRRMGWPLTPFTCGVLMLLTPAAVKQMGAEGDRTLATWYVGTLLAITLFGACLSQFRVLLDRTVRAYESGWSPLCLHLGYLVIFAAIVIGGVALARLLLPMVTIDAAAAEIVLIALIVWLLYASFAGATFDGRLDRRLDAVPHDVKAILGTEETG